MNIALVGSTGLVGSRIKEILSTNHQVSEFNTSQGFDITDITKIEVIKSDSSQVVIHLAAKSNVDQCENDKDRGENGEAWKVNVKGTENIIKICEESGKKLIYISTDFVFDGEKDGEYTEEDKPNPINWYGTTKLEGEFRVQKSNTDWIIARIAYPYRAVFEKLDLLRMFQKLLKEKEEIDVVADHMMTPTFIDDIATALETLATQQTSGIYHVVGSSHHTPIQVAEIVKKHFGGKAKLNTVLREKYFASRAPRARNLALNNDKILNMGVNMSTFEEGILKAKNQIS